MLSEFLALMAARRGHFLLESGHHGELWLDVDRLFRRPRQLRPLVAELAARLSAHRIDAVCGPLTGGAFLAAMVAEELGVDFVFAERVVRGERAGALFPVEYPIPAALADILGGRRVAVVNDVTNAGSAVRGALRSLVAGGAMPAAIACLLTLGDAAANLAAEHDVPLISLAAVDNPLWEPAVCPHCAAGEPLENPGG